MQASTNERNARRRELRLLMQPFAAPSYMRALSLVGLDLALYAAGFVLVVVMPWMLGKVAGSLILGLAISRMFVLGHDAGHQSLTPSLRVNNFLGRMLFLPSLSPYSVWEAGHNIAHHGFAGLRGRDIPWVPLSPEQYRALSRGAQFAYRTYRAWWGAGLYYGHAIWWRRMYFPKGKNRRAFILDSWLVTVFLVLEIALFAWAARATGQSGILLLTLGILLPFVIWLYVAAFVFYIHHTDETARWYDSIEEWRAVLPDLDATHGTRLSFGLHVFLHNALEHTAHHVNAAIPSYRLGAAQRVLETQFPDEVPVRKITFRRYVAITRRCQLYDATCHQWVTFVQISASPASISGMPGASPRAARA